MPSRVLSRFLTVLAIFFVCGILLIAILPTLLSTSWGTRQLTSLLNTSIPGNLEIKKVDLNWFSNQTIEGLLLKDPEGNPVLEFNKFTTEAPLWKMILKKSFFGQSQLQDLNAWIKSDDQGISNLQHALQKLPKNHQSYLTSSTIVLSDFNATLSLFSPKAPLSILASGKTQSGEMEGSVKIEAIFPNFSAEDWTKLTQSGQKVLKIDDGKEATLHAKIENFPVELIDRISSLKNQQLNGIFYALLGDKLNVSIDKTPNSEGINFNLDITATRANGTINGIITDDTVSIQKPALFTFNLEPSVINPLLRPHLQLSEKSELQLVISEFIYPLTGRTEVNPNKVGLIATAQILGHTPILLPPSHELDIVVFSASLFSELGKEDIILESSGRVGHKLQEEPLAWRLKATLDKAETIRDLRLVLKEKTPATLRVSHLPLNFFTTSDKNREIFEQMIGRDLDLELTANQEKNEEIDLSLNVKAAKLDIQQAKLKLGKRIKLLKPITISTTVQPSVLASLLPSEAIHLDQEIPVSLEIEKFDIDLSNTQQSQIQSHLKIPSIKITQKKLGSFEIQQFLLSTYGNPFSLIKNSTSFQILANDQLSPFIGNQARFKASSELSLSSIDKVEIPTLRGEFISDKLTFNVNGQWLDGNLLIMSTPFEAQYKITPNDLTSLGIFTDEIYPKLQNIPQIKLTIDPFKLDLKTVTLSSLNVNGVIFIDQITFKDTSGRWVCLEKIESPWQINGPKNEIQVNINAQTSSNQNQTPSPLTAGLQLLKWHSDHALDFKHTQALLFSRIAGIPASLLTSIAIKKDLTPLLGPFVDLELKVSYDLDDKAPGSLIMDLNSSLVHAETHLLFNEHLQMLEDKPFEFRWTLTPEGYHYITNLNGYKENELPVLKAPVTFTGNVTKFEMPWKMKENVLANGKIEAKINSTEIGWKNSTIPSLSLNAKVLTDPSQDQLNFIITTDSKTDAKLKINGSIAHLNNKLNFAKSDLTIQLEANQLPSALFMGLQPKIQALFGDTINSTASVQLKKMSGPIAANINGANGSTKFNGEINRGMLTLQKPLEIETTLTPALGKAFNAPILTQVIRADKPLKVIIDSQGLKAKVIPFDLKELEIATGSIKLGKVLFRNEGALSTIVSILKPNAGPTINIWFTPLYFQLAKGILTLHRMDMLVGDQYHLATWGAIDIISKNTDMVVGLSGEALSQIVNISGIEDDYMFQIPLKGKNGNVGIDKASALSRLSAIAVKAKGNATTRLLGNILEMAVSGGDPRPPEPTTQPFPWAQNRPAKSQKHEEPQQRQEQQRGEKKRSKMKQPDPLKELEKEASTLINDLFR